MRRCAEGQRQQAATVTVRDSGSVLCGDCRAFASSGLVVRTSTWTRMNQSYRACSTHQLDFSGVVPVPSTSRSTSRLQLLASPILSRLSDHISISISISILASPFSILVSEFEQKLVPFFFFPITPHFLFGSESPSLRSFFHPRSVRTYVQYSVIHLHRSAKAATF